VLLRAVCAVRLQLIDFGLTKHIESARTMLVGTPGEDKLSGSWFVHTQRIAARRDFGLCLICAMYVSEHELPCLLAGVAARL
jgi:hypothetical protein